MSQAVGNLSQTSSLALIDQAIARRTFAFALITVMLVAALLAGAVPIGFSIVTVFLFAGPHNWVEFRYFLSKMPAHWGPMRTFFIVAIVGTLGLSTLFAAIPFLGTRWQWDARTWGMASATWNSLLLIWLASLIVLRGHQRPGRDWSWAIPIALAMIAVVWIVPQAWDVALVYLHPLIALLFLDRELGRRRPQWRSTYRSCLLMLPILLTILWWKLANSAPLAGQDMITMRITRHAGAQVLAGVSSHLLVSTHTFLEMLHYGVWLMAMPLIALRTSPWKLESVPLVRRSNLWRGLVIGIIATGGIAVLVLWACFLGNYGLTRDVYFTMAIAHVLAEFPFLLRTF